MFGLLDFMRALTAVYTVLMLVWTAKCCQYRRELMSIHVLISAALLLLALDALAHWAALAAYNADGARCARGHGADGAAGRTDERAAALPGAGHCRRVRAAAPPHA